MPRPIVSQVAEDIYAALGPWSRRDAEIGETTDNWRVLEIAEAIGGRLQPIEDITRDSDDYVGWGIIMDPDFAPEEWLPWLAQLGGVRVKEGLALPEQRVRLKALANAWRGSPSSIVGAAQQFLTGTKTVYLVERHGSANRLTVTTLTAETPDPVSVDRAIRTEQKPAGIILTVSNVAGGNYNSLRDTHSDYNDVVATFQDYAEVLANPTKP